MQLRKQPDMTLKAEPKKPADLFILLTQVRHVLTDAEKLKMRMATAL